MTLDRAKCFIASPKRYPSICRKGKGHMNASRFFFVVFTMRDDIIRPVRAFKASKRFRDEYVKKAKGPR